MLKRRVPSAIRQNESCFGRCLWRWGLKRSVTCWRELLARRLSVPNWPADGEHTQYETLARKMTPRIIRHRDAPSYLGMDRNRFNAEVRPHLTEIPIGKQGIGFDRHELDAWVDEYVARNGRPARQKGVSAWDASEYRASSLRDGVWHIDKRIFGRRVCQSTGTPQLEEAERQLARVMEETRQAQVYGVRPTRTFEQAAAKYVLENQHKRSLRDDVGRLKNLMPWIGQVQLDKLHMGVLHAWLDRRRHEGVAMGTINQGLQVVRRILISLPASGWTIKV